MLSTYVRLIELADKQSMESPLLIVLKKEFEKENDAQKLKKLQEILNLFMQENLEVKNITNIVERANKQLQELW